LYQRYRKGPEDSEIPLTQLSVRLLLKPLYAENLVPTIKAAPHKYDQEWKQAQWSKKLESSDESIEANASKICDQCWELQVGEMEISTIDGKYDFGGDAVVSGKNATEFR
jgi:hypothetical protein